MENECDFYSFDDLSDRLSTIENLEKKPVVFIVGSPLSSPTNNSEYGVPNVEGIIRSIRSVFINDNKALDDFDNAIIAANQNNYQEAFRFLLGRRGQDSINKIIKLAVLKSYTDSSQLNKLFDTYGDITDDNCQLIERKINNWHLSPGMKALGCILTKYYQYFGKIILTTNFDPLIELSIKQNNGIFFKTVTDKDGNISQTTGEGTHVIHLHGYWYGYDTLHTPRQLTQGRALLKSSLSNLISNCTICVIGYGGWDDIFTTTIADVVNDSDYKSQLIWTFYESSISKIYECSTRLISKLRPGLSSGRVQFFSGINCHQIFPYLLSKLKSKSEAKNKIYTQLGSNNNQASHTAERPLAPDNPPYIEIFVGRKSLLSG